MYKKLLLLSILFSGASGHAQKVLNTPQQPATVLDPVSISMQPGFSFRAADNSVFVARIGQPIAVTPVSPGTATPYTPISVSYNSGNLSTSENYIYKREYLVPVTTETPGAQQIQGVQYFDGLGRPKQTIAIKATPKGNDLVTTVPYDGFGRQADSWLPVPMASQSGGIQSGVEGAAQSYYGSNYSSASGNPETNPFVHKSLEDSPLDRLLSVTNPGSDWQNKPVGYTYDANSDADNVLKYTTTTTWTNNATSSSISLSGSYAAASLYKYTITDEDGNQGIEFKNGQGQTVLSRKILNGGSIDTYYVYNEYDQLAYVIPPMLAAKQTWGQADQDALAYQYRYDGRNRLVEKKLPGKDWEYMVYDGQDRFVATQDGNMRQKGLWLFTKYDQFGRVAYTGFTTGSDRSSEQGYADGKITGTNNALRNPGGSIAASGMTAYYVNDTTPTPECSSPAPYPPTIIELLSVNYYDEYPADTPYLPGSIQNQTVIRGIAVSAPDNPNTQITTKGLALAGYIRNIEKDGNGNYGWTRNYTYYDIRGRGIGTYSQNYMGGYTRTESLLKFSGKPEAVYTYHKQNPAAQEKVIKESFVYDHQERLVQHRHQVNGGAETLLAENIYNELGQLQDKNVGDRMQTMSYAHNIRGWMTRLNNPNNLGGRLFGYELKYQNPATNTTTAARYNGNIAQMDWSSQNDGVLRRYDYFYDQLNRLGQAAYSKPNSSVVATNTYNESATYDKNGNIATLSRYGGMDGNQAMQIDALTYTYSGNQLQSVGDASGNYMGYPAGGGSAISYDANGNMAGQPDRGISAIAYNFLNLPYLVTQTGGNMAYTYRADGVKLRKGYGAKVDDYLDGFQYENGVLQFVPTAEGYYDFTKNAYIYNVVDHLGNVRVSYWKNGAGALEILEESNYYPFGLRHQGYNSTMANNQVYQYKYNGKELQETGMYDYGARFYMPDIGRWISVDPLAETTPSWSPYAYGFNNPVRFIDPTGMANEDWVKQGNRIFYDPSVHGQDEVGKKYSGGQSITGYWVTQNDVTTHYNLGDDGSITTTVGNLDFLTSTKSVYNSGNIETGIATIEGQMCNTCYPTVGPIPESRGKTEIQMLVAENPLVQDAVVGAVTAGAGSWLMRSARGATIAEETYSVYHGLDVASDIRYVGITKQNPLARFGQHIAGGGEKGLLDFRTITSGLTKTEARIMEQNLINQYGLQKNGGQLLNKINSIAPKYWGTYGVTPP